MKQHKLLRISSATLIGFSALAILMVSLMAFQNPQAVMDLIQVKLPNNDAFSSIRGVYGGVGLTIFISLVYLAFKDHTKGLAFAAILWGSYALSRLMTISLERPLGAFGQQADDREFTLYSCGYTIDHSGKTAGTKRISNKKSPY